MMATSTLYNVPDEILRKIFEYLEGTLDNVEWYMYGLQANVSGLAGLASLCRTCRRFQHLAQPLLHRTVLLEGAEETSNVFLKFAKTLVGRPQLGDNIRTFTALDDDLRDGNLYQSATRLLDLPPKFAAFYDACGGYPSKISYAAMLIAFMPNLELLDLTLSETPMLAYLLSGRHYIDFDNNKRLVRLTDTVSLSDSSGGVDALNSTANTEPTTLSSFGNPKLKEVRLKNCGNESATSITALEPILLNPWIETLRLLGVNWFGRTADEMQWNDIPCSIRTLELHESLFDASGVENILQRFHRLGSLTLDHGDVRRGMQVRGSDMELDGVGDILRKYGKNLTELSINTEEHEWSRDCLGPLQTLSKLRHLRVGKTELTGEDRWGSQADSPLRNFLPLSLETLYLFYDSNYYMGNQSWAIESHEILRTELVELALSGEFPHLREIKIEGLTISLGPLQQNLEGWSYSVVDMHLGKRPHSSGRVLPVMTLSKTQ
jgi:hypothetical protein